MNKFSIFGKMHWLPVVVSILAFFISCTEPPHTPKDLLKEALIPQPVFVEADGSSFSLTDKTAIVLLNGESSGDPEGAEKVARYLAGLLKPATGFDVQVRTSGSESDDGNIYLQLNDSGPSGIAESYELSIMENRVKLTAGDPAGLFRGIQTLRQLLPPSIEKNTPQQGPWEIATGTIRDSPAYPYRGGMLDVARHFFKVEDVKKYIDYLAMYKMNALHLHLSDDQGWRIEIKSWPELTTRGGSTEVGGGEGGFYTQEEFKEIVQYADDRYIMVIPEIDMPGHTNAALASYAELNCDDKLRELYTGIEVGFSTFCTDKEVVYKFIDDVFGELAGLINGPYIHIGGDESHVTALEDYIPFVNRVQEIVKSHGKQVIGWDEIANATLLPNTKVQYWAEAENAKKGIAQGAEVIMSPARKVYLDMQYDSTTRLGLHWAAYIEVDSSYIWDPATLENGIEKQHIFGVEAPLWTETIDKLDDLEYMVFPRLPGVAEIGWTPASERNWADYRLRLGAQKKRFEALGIDYYPSAKVPWSDTLVTRPLQ